MSQTRNRKSPFRDDFLWVHRDMNGKRNMMDRAAWELKPPGVGTLGGSSWLNLYQWRTWRSQERPSFHTTRREKPRKEWIHTPSDVGPNPFISTKEVQSKGRN